MPLDKPPEKYSRLLRLGAQYIVILSHSLPPTGNTNNIHGLTNTQHISFQVHALNCNGALRRIWMVGKQGVCWGCVVGVHTATWYCISLFSF